MIGTTTTIRNTRRVLYPSISICQELWTDLIFNYEEVKEMLGSTIMGKDININLESFTTSPPIYSILERIDYFKRTNETRYQM